MRLVVRQPSAALAPFVRSISLVEAHDEATRILLPDTGMTLGLRYSGSAAELNHSTAPLPDASFSGLRGQARTMRTSAGGAVVIARFRETGAGEFFGEPLHELFGATLDLASVIPTSLLERIRQQLAEAPSDEARVALMEAFLLQRRRYHSPDLVVASAVTALRQSSGTLRIEALAKRLGLGRDRLEKRFRSVVGTTPKHHASLLRFQRALRLQRAGRPLSEVALEAGYFDQSHLNRDFRALVGAPPQRFLASAEHSSCGVDQT